MNTKKKKAQLERGVHLINLKVSKAQHAQIKANAKTYTEGNVSRWLRQVGCGGAQAKKAPPKKRLTKK